MFSKNTKKFSSTAKAFLRVRTTTTTPGTGSILCNDSFATNMLLGGGALVALLYAAVIQICHVRIDRKARS